MHKHGRPADTVVPDRDRDAASKCSRDGRMKEENTIPLENEDGEKLNRRLRRRFPVRTPDAMS